MMRIEVVVFPYILCKGPNLQDSLALKVILTSENKKLAKPKDFLAQYSKNTTTSSQPGKLQTTMNMKI